MELRLKTKLCFGSAAAAAALICALGAPPAHALPPKVISTSFSHVTATSVLLEANINPEGKNVVYRFEYGPSDCSTEPCTTSPSLEGTLLTKATSPEPVSAPLSGLSPGTTYHFRIVVTNTSKEVAEGPDTVFKTRPLPSSPSACPNEAFRKDKPSAALPDCRAYEQASAADKNGANVEGAPNEVQASTDGSAVTFFSPAGLPGAVGAQDFETYLARRGEANWLTRGVFPPASAGPIARNAGWTPDLSQFFSNVSSSFHGPWTFRVRSSADESFAPITTGERESFLAATSADGSVVYFQSPVQLLEEAAPGVENLYAWDRDAETLSLVGVLPDSACAEPPCVPPGGSFAGPYEWFANLSKGNPFSAGLDSFNSYYVQNEHAVSNDGSKAYFTAGGGQLYLREDPTGPAPTSVHVSESQRTVPDPNGTRAAAFMAATPDGSSAFFTSAEKLTDNATTGPEVTKPPTIAQADISGSPVDISFLPAHAHGLAVDGKYLYWADPTDDTIGRAELDGSNPEREFIKEADNPQYVTVAGEYVYWTNAKGEGEDEGSIGRAKLSGDGVEDVKQEFIPTTTYTHLETSYGLPGFETTVFNPRGIAVDGSHIYWGDVGSNGVSSFSSALMRANLEGGEVEEYGEFENTPGKGDYHPRHLAPQGMAIAGNYIYFGVHATISTSYLVRQSLLDPRAPAVVVVEPGEVEGVAADASHVYWANRTTNMIGRANLELNEVKEDFIKEAEHPQGLAANATDLYWSANQEVPANPGNDLYRFDAETGDLSDISVDGKDVNGAEVQGVLGASEDGSYLYFAANGDLDGAGPATAGDCRAGTGGGGFLAGSGSCSLYLRHGGEVSFIAPLRAGGGESDAANWEPQGQPSTHSAVENTARVSADGKTLLFRSQEQLTDYEHKGVAEFYRYDTEEGLSCLTCNPTNAPPVRPLALQSIEPELPVVEPPHPPAIMTRNLSADGNRFFFESSDELVEADVDGDGQDVYEWEAKGTGSCDSEAQNGGCLYLLTSGNSPEPAYFADASASGDDVFLFTSESLVPQDKDQIQDVYDLRVGGGLASQNKPQAAICDSVEGCHGESTPHPEPESPKTSQFNGPGNVKGKSKPCPKGKHAVRRHGKTHCVAKKHHKRHRRAKTSGGAGR